MTIEKPGRQSAPDALPVKTCKRCGEERAVDEFHPQRKSKDGLQSWCKECYREWDRERYRKDPEKAHAKMKAWRMARQVSDPEGWLRYKRDTHLRSRYGVSLDEWEEMYDQQLGRCAICRQIFADEGPHLDHDSATGQVRGLLCRLCNVGLGHFRENLNYLNQATQYLIEHSSGRERSIEGTFKAHDPKEVR